MLDFCDEAALDADEINEGEVNPDVDDDKGFMLLWLLLLLELVT